MDGGLRLAVGSNESGASVRRRMTGLLILLIVAMVALASIAFIVLEWKQVPLTETEGGVMYLVDGLPGAFYKSWDHMTVSIYSGTPHHEGNDIIYPVWGGWILNQSALTGTWETIFDFGAKNLKGTWFNLNVFDLRGDGIVSNRDGFTITSHNGSFPLGVDYYIRFGDLGVGDGGIAPFYTVLGFRFAQDGFHVWVESPPNRIAM